MRRSRFEDNREYYAMVGRGIAEVRQRLKITQEALAKKVSLTRTSIINIEKGRQQLLLHTLVAIARALNTSPAELIPGEQDVEALLQTKPKKGREWIMKSALGTERKEV